VPDLSVLVRDRDLCLEGFAHGGTYTVTLAAGLPARDGAEVLAEPATREVTVADRRPALSFRGQGYILPSIGAEGLPLRSVNVDRARLQVLRIADRALVEQIYYGRINQTLTDFDVGAILEQKGEVVWKGEIATGGDRNRTRVTPFPIDVVLGSLSPGVYIAVAEDASLPVVAWDQRATQWFVVSDVGLTSFRASNGLFVFARSLGSAAPLTGVELRLVSRDNTELGRAVTGADGMARFETGTLAANGPKAPQALFAAAPGGGFSLLDFGAPAVELADRSGGGRSDPGDLDSFLAVGQAVYRPGDRIQVTALLRDAAARAVAGRDLILRLVRPDGLELARQTVADQGLGGYAAGFDLPATAPEGSWTLTAQADANGPVIGRTEVTVGEVAPPRLSFSLTADRPRIAADGRATVRVDGRYLQGNPAARLPGELRLTLRTAESPWPELQGYRFGLVQDPFTTEDRPLDGFTTNAEGGSRVQVALGDLPRTSQPLESVLTATLHDIGGRPVRQDLVLPVDHQAFAIGIRPDFAGDAVPEGATVAFDVVAVAPDGRRMVRSGLAWELYEEEFDYAWFEAEGRWDYRTTVRDRRLTGGTIDAAADAPALIEEQVKAGRYRLEVFDPATGIASSVRFSAGWWVSAKSGEAPDQVEVAVEQALEQPGETARVFIRPPYPATVLVTVADRAVRHTTTHQVGADGMFLDLPVPADLTAGAYVMATAFAPAEADRRAPPRRAVGIGWIGLDPAPRTLDVAVTPPDAATPGETVTLPVTVRGLAPGETAKIALRAVDERLRRGPEGAGAEGTGAETRRADPIGWYLGKRDLTVELRDVYGRLPTPVPAATPPAKATTAAPAAPARAGTPAPRVEGPPAASFFSGVLAVSADGTVAVPLTLPPAGQGRLAVEVVAWSEGRIGRADGVLPVRVPLDLTLIVPTALVPGDSAQLSLALENVAGRRGDYSVALSLTGPFTLEGNATANFRGLQRGRRQTGTRTLTATGEGEGVLTATITGPDGFTATRTVTLSAQAPLRADPVRMVQEIAPGATGAGGAELAGPAVLVAGAWPDLDVAALMLADSPLEAESVEQLAGRLLALLELPDLARTLAGEEEPAFRARVQGMIDRLAAWQRADGAFAQWGGEGPVEPWLTPFALDVLTRAREAGYQVPEAGYRRGLDWLVRTIANSWVDQAELSARAYALYTAARAKAIDAAPVLYFHETYFDRLPTRFAQAQVAAAFALLDNGERARAVIGQVAGTRQPEGRIRDFGTDLRDRAAALSLLAAAGGEPDRLGADLAGLRDLMKPASRTSTQERAWLLAAAAQLARRAGPAGLTIDGAPAPAGGLVVKALAAGQTLPALRNGGERPVHLAVTPLGATAGGVANGAADGSAPAPEAMAEGFELTRKVVDLKGKEIDPARIRPGDLLVVLLSGKATSVPAGPVLVADRVPAGFAVESVRLAGSAQLGGLSWLDGLTVPAHAAFQPRSFAAALDKDQAMGFQLAYLVRAAGQGSFTWPGAVVEDLVEPAHHARTAAATVTVRPPPPPPRPPTPAPNAAPAAAPASAPGPAPAATAPSGQTGTPGNPAPAGPAAPAQTEPAPSPSASSQPAPSR
jgi:uncharacterized protein YfaS (alpha-2-macroglobulin family)